VNVELYVSLNGEETPSDVMTLTLKQPVELERNRV